MVVFRRSRHRPTKNGCEDSSETAIWKCRSPRRLFESWERSMSESKSRLEKENEALHHAVAVLGDFVVEVEAARVQLIAGSREEGMKMLTAALEKLPKR